MIPRVYVPEKIYFEPGSYVWLKQKKYWREDKKMGEMVQVVYELDTHSPHECDAVLARVIGCYSNYISFTILPHIYVPEKIYFEPGSYVWLKQKKYWGEDKKTGEMSQVVYELDTHPWGECDAVLARVIGCYSNYISFTILPHMNPNGMTNEYTRPYNQSIHKHDIFLGNTIVEPVKLSMPSGK